MAVWPVLLYVSVRVEAGRMGLRGPGTVSLVDSSTLTFVNTKS